MFSHVPPRVFPLLLALFAFSFPCQSLPYLPASCCHPSKSPWGPQGGRLAPSGHRCARCRGQGAPFPATRGTAPPAQHQLPTAINNPRGCLGGHTHSRAISGLDGVQNSSGNNRHPPAWEEDAQTPSEPATPAPRRGHVPAAPAGAAGCMPPARFWGPHSQQHHTATPNSPAWELLCSLPAQVAPQERWWWSGGSCSERLPAASHSPGSGSGCFWGKSQAGRSQKGLC